MSNRSDSFSTSMETILTTNWDVRDGNVIPNASDVALKNGAVKIEAAFLYADLAGSSKLARICPWQTTAKIIRAYLDCCTRIIRSRGGHIKSFDGDRVMGVFKGTTPCTDAVACAREIDWMVHNVLNAKAKAKFDSIKNNGLTIKHCVGVDYGETYAVRAGIRDNNDLIWIGKVPSLAAKLSDKREYPFEVCISSQCYNNMVKPDNVSELWSRDDFTFAGESIYIYKSKTPMQP